MGFNSGFKGLMKVTAAFSDRNG